MVKFPSLDQQRFSPNLMMKETQEDFKILRKASETLLFVDLPPSLRYRSEV